MKTSILSKFIRCEEARDYDMVKRGDSESDPEMAQVLKLSDSDSK